MKRWLGLFMVLGVLGVGSWVVWGSPAGGLSLFLPVVNYAGGPELAGCPVFPVNNIWNVPIDELPVHSQSAAYINTIGAGAEFHADFGSGVWPPDSNSPIGIPYVVVPGNQPGVSVAFEYDDESDQVPYPVPPNPPIEGGPEGGGDRHILMLDSDNCVLYELYRAYPVGDGTWEAGSGAVFDLRSHVLRPDGWTSSDAAGLPILPGLVRYDEVASWTRPHERFICGKMYFGVNLVSKSHVLGV